MATPLLLAGGLLLAVVLLALPPASASSVGWAIAGSSLVHAAVAWWTPVRTRANDLATATVTAIVTATAAVSVAAILLAAGLHAWAILLRVPVLHATSMFGRVVAVGTTVLASLGGTCVLVLTAGPGRLEITTCFRDGELEIVTRYAPTAGPAYLRLVDAVRTDCGSTLVSEGPDVATLVVQALESSGADRATSESCTGGQLVARLIDSWRW